jgi:hypothetical protein
MKLTLVRVPWRPRLPLWALAVVAVWVAVGLMTVWLSHRTGVHVTLCMFKHVTGWPCPTCGSTRGFLSVLGGDVLGPWRYNPLLSTVFAGIVASVVLRVLFKRAVRVTLSRRERYVAWAVAVALILLNWAYVIRIGDRLPPPRLLQPPPASAPAPR